VFVAKEGADDRQAQPDRSTDGRETVAQVMRSNASQAGRSTHSLPGTLNRCVCALGFRPGEHPRIFRHAREFLEQDTGRRIDIHNFRSSLAVGQAQAFALKIDVVPAQVDDFTTPAASQ
jgi:hypothetical protein